MNDLDHRVGVSEANLVVRHLKLEAINDDNKQLIIDEIDQEFGIDSVSFDDDSKTLNVAYDAVRCKLHGIEDIVKKHGADISHNWWTHFKESYYQFVDQNMKDNAKHKPLNYYHTPRSK
jgi:hypothetical protein